MEIKEVSVCITTFNRPELLKQVIDDLAENAGCKYELIIGDDVSTDVRVKEVLDYAIEKYNASIMQYMGKIPHSKNVNNLFSLAHGNYLVHLEDDIIIPHKGWLKRIVEVMIKHPEIGLLGPDYPGHHLRLEHKDWSESDYIMGGVQLISREIFKQIGYWDPYLTRSQEPDFALRVRLAGYKVGMLREFSWVHLAPDYVGAVSKISDKSVLDFLRKWNMYFLGYFSYKSPLMLYWDCFPPNAMLRKQIFAQQRLNQNLEQIVIQNHNCDVIKVPYAPNSYMEKELLDILELDCGKIKNAEYEKIDQDLLTGKRKWNIEDFKKEQEIN